MRRPDEIKRELERLTVEVDTSRTRLAELREKLSDARAIIGKGVVQRALGGGASGGEGTPPQDGAQEEAKAG
jgi:hypothetical protein